MNDDVWKRQEIESPCVKLCSIHPVEGICVGCMRTMDEIVGWSGFSAEDRRQLMDHDLPARAPRLRVRRGGRTRARQSS
ncbi:MAG: DUF1289 domain-containing protein [Pseudomonadota bacterium]